MVQPRHQGRASLELPPAGANVTQRLIVVALSWVAVTWQWLRDTVLNF